MQTSLSKNLIFYSRRVSQLFFLLVFLFLFIRTDYRGYDQLEYAVNILFRLDPYLAAVTMLAARSIIALMLPAVAVLLLALFLGRSFCGWFCPMGTLLDCSRYSLPTDSRGKKTLFPRLGLILFFLSLVLALFGFSIYGFIDPFSILVRGLVQSVYPVFHSLTDQFFTFTYTSAPEIVNHLTEPVYEFMNKQVLPSEQKLFELAYLSFFVLASVLLLEIVQKRFFCRNICPLGALLGVFSGKGCLQAAGGADECGKCRICSSICRMGAIDDNRAIDMSVCNVCMECTVKCPRQIISIGFGRPGSKVNIAGGISRRQFVGAALAGVILPSIKGVSTRTISNNPMLIRPPGALAEQEFLGRCVRCAECIQVCIGNALQPALLEGGIDGLFSPKLVARTGYCEFNCTLCGQVCPTGAISILTFEQKHVFKIGHAWFDKNICLPYAKMIPCMVCEEHCPTPEKAIRFRQVDTLNDNDEKITIKQPYIVDELCIGCGICENKCPLPGKSAVIVTSAGEERDPKKSLPTPAGSAYSPLSPYG